MTEEEQLALFPLFLKGVALDWYDNLGDSTRLSTRQLLSEYRGYFCPTNLDRVLDPDSIFCHLQKPQEKARDYVAVMQKLARRLPGVDEEMLRCMVVRGLRPHLKAFVLQQNCKTLRLWTTAGTIRGDNGRGRHRRRWRRAIRTDGRGQSVKSGGTSANDPSEQADD